MKSYCSTTLSADVAEHIPGEMRHIPTKPLFLLTPKYVDIVAIQRCRFRKNFGRLRSQILLVHTERQQKVYQHACKFSRFIDGFSPDPSAHIHQHYVRFSHRKARDEPKSRVCSFHIRYCVIQITYILVHLVCRCLRNSSMVKPQSRNKPPPRHVFVAGNRINLGYYKARA